MRPIALCGSGCRNGSGKTVMSSQNADGGVMGMGLQVSMQRRDGVHIVEERLLHEWGSWRLVTLCGRLRG